MNYYSFSQYLKNTFGTRVHRISLNAGFSCPNINGTLSSDGCIFCNNKSFSHFAKQDNILVEEQIAQSMEYLRSRFNAEKFIAYFQSFTGTHGEINFLEEQYNIIRRFDDIVGLAISTRPDCIDEEKLDLIESFAEDYKVYIEYGLQSIHDKTLREINRNHNFGDFVQAVRMTAERSGINIGVHVFWGYLLRQRNICL